MADITNQYSQHYNGGIGQYTMLFEIWGATAADTFNASQWFSKVSYALIGPLTGTSSPGTGSISGATTITIPTGPSNDSLWLLIVGSGLGQQ